MTFYPAAKKPISMKKLQKNSQAVVIIVLYALTFPCSGGDFFWEISGTGSAYAEHLEWQKSFQWNRKQAFQIYKRQYNYYLEQKEARLRERLRNQDRGRMERQQSELKKEWDAEQRAYQITRMKVSREYIKNRNWYRKQKKFKGYSPKQTKHSREFVL